jgi:predicted Zn-dependent protease with MMP-like domain
MILEEFEKLVAEAVESLPENIKNAMKNVAIVVEENPKRDNLLGLYEGVPNNQWGKDQMIHLPDKITIFKPIIEAQAQTPEDVKELTRVVVWHEIAHHFGFDEKEVRQLEKRWKK